MTQIDYNGLGFDEQVSFNDCTFCDANDVGDHTLLRFQQDGGWTIWAIYVDKDASPGLNVLTPDYSGSYVTLSANNAELPPEAQGMYFGDTNMGTVTFTEVDHSPGGLIAGSVEVIMMKGDTMATLEAEFSAQLP